LLRSGSKEEKMLTAPFKLIKAKVALTVYTHLIIISELSHENGSMAMFLPTA